MKIEVHRSNQSGTSSSQCQYLCQARTAQFCSAKRAPTPSTPFSNFPGADKSTSTSFPLAQRVNSQTSSSLLIASLLVLSTDDPHNPLSWPTQRSPCEHASSSPTDCCLASNSSCKLHTKCLCLCPRTQTRKEHHNMLGGFTN